MEPIDTHFERGTSRASRLTFWEDEQITVSRLARALQSPCGLRISSVLESEYSAGTSFAKNLPMGDATSGCATLQDIVTAYDVLGDAGLEPYRGRAALLHSEL